MTFSIFIPTRARLELLIDLLQSISDTTSDFAEGLTKDAIWGTQVCVVYDYDDMPTEQSIKSLRERFQFASFHGRPRGESLSRDYHGWILPTLTGDFLIAPNDDCLFVTPNWDNLLREKLTEYLADKPDGIVYGWINDNLSNRWGMGYCCFPLLSREAIDALGWWLPPDCPFWGADVVLWRIFDAVQRICDLSCMTIEHVSYHNGLRDIDETGEHVSQQVNPDVRSRDVTLDVERLKAAIGRYVTAY